MPEGWSDLFVATAGASAALAGLVFVAVSINVERILHYRGLPERGLVTVLLLLGVLVVSVFGLVPDQSLEAFGRLVLIESLALSAVAVWLIWRSRPAPGEESHVASSLTIAAIGTVPFVVAGILLVAGIDGGLGWTVVGIVSALIGAVANAWVLLVEILR